MVGRTPRVGPGDDVLVAHVERVLDSPDCEDHTSGTVALTVDEGDLERGRIALRALARSAEARALSLAATRVEIALEGHLDDARAAPGPIDVEFDATVVALVSLALFERSSSHSADDPFREQGDRFLQHLRASDPTLSDAVSSSV